MSVENTKITTQIETAHHTVKCDDCGRELGTYEEYLEDGYWYNPHRYTDEIYIKHLNEYLEFSRDLCEDCAKQFYFNLKKCLMDIGYGKDGK